MGESFLQGEAMMKEAIYDAVRQAIEAVGRDAEAGPDTSSNAAQCFVCKMPLTEWKCMTPTCPKNKYDHTDDSIRYYGTTPYIEGFDPVAKPSHYNQGEGIECIEYIKQVLGPDGFIAYCRGNMMKYNHRAMYKGNPTEDLAKAAQYLTWVNETLRDKHK
jgi:hypothetical protein